MYEYIYIYILVVEVSLAVLSVTNDRNDRQGLSRVLASADASRILCLLLCSRVGKVITSARADTTPVVVFLDSEKFEVEKVFLK